MLKTKDSKDGIWVVDLDLLRNFRDLEEISPEDMGHAVGLSGMTIRNIEAGKSPVTLNLLLAIGNKFGKDPRKFLRRKPDPVTV